MKYYIAFIMVATIGIKTFIVLKMQLQYSHAKFYSRLVCAKALRQAQRC